jgi:GAG-pre-integrase domain
MTLVENGISLTFEGHLVKFSRNNKVFAEGAARGNLYYLTVLPVGTVNVADVDRGIMWHLRLNHASAGILEKLKSQCAELKGVVFPSVFDCKDCAIGSVKKSNFPRMKEDYKPLQMVAVDMCGLFRTRSLGG